MKLKLIPILYRAVHEGVSEGLQISLEESKKPENAGNPHIIKDVVTAVVLQHLSQIIDLDDEIVQMHAEEQTEETEVQ